MFWKIFRQHYILCQYVINFVERSFESIAEHVAVNGFNFNKTNKSEAMNEISDFTDIKIIAKTFQFKQELFRLDGYVCIVCLVTREKWHGLLTSNHNCGYFSTSTGGISLQKWLKSSIVLLTAFCCIFYPGVHFHTFTCIQSTVSSTTPQRRIISRILCFN